MSRWGGPGTTPFRNKVASIIVVYNYGAAKKQVLFKFLLVFYYDDNNNNNEGWVLIFRVRINKMVLIVSILIQPQ